MEIPKKCPKSVSADAPTAFTHCVKCGGKLVAGKTHREKDARATEIVCKGCGGRYASIDMKIPYSSESEKKGIEEDLAWKKFIANTPLEEIRRPIALLLLPDAAEVDATDMGKYQDIFFALESSVFSGWNQKPALRDNDVLEAFQTLLDDFDSQPEGSLAWLLATSLKARLLFRKGRGGTDFTLGEAVSCVKLLIRIAHEHENSTGDGYLWWARAFFTTGLPQTPGENLDYLLENG